MPAEEVVCRDCKRTGTQRFKKVGRGKNPFVCTDEVACLKRQGKPVTKEARKAKAQISKDRAKIRRDRANRVAKATKARARTNGASHEKTSVSA